MFRKNDVSNDQMNLFSKENNWSEYKKKRLKQSWAEVFRTKIMPNINEEPYRVLYSDVGSRPNTPVNILVGLLIIKPLTGDSDDSLLDTVFFNEKVQYALGILNDDEDLISKNMISNFRMRIFNYEAETGINLFDNTLKEINDYLLEMTKIDKKLKRVDSLMISSSCKDMTRTELIYKVNEMFIKLLKKKNKKIAGKFKNYLEQDNEIKVLYQTKESEIHAKLTMLLNESIDLYKRYKNDKEVNETEEFKNLERLINDQYDNDKKAPKDGKDIKPISMQTPYDKDATYRFKYKSNKGYVGNVVEAVDQEKELALITDWDVASNVKSDKEFMKEMIEKKETKEKEIIVADAAYYSKELKDLAEEKNTEIHPTDLTGYREKETILNEFEVNEDNTVEACPIGEKALSSKYDEQNNMLYADFEKEKCVNCSRREKCPIKLLKNKAKLAKSLNQIERAQLMAKRNTEEYKKISHVRSGIEGIPSVLRRKYNIDHRGSKGLPYLRMLFSSSMLAINIKKITKYENKPSKKGSTNPVLANLLLTTLKFLKLQKSYC